MACVTFIKSLSNTNADADTDANADAPQLVWFVAFPRLRELTPPPPPPNPSPCLPDSQHRDNRKLIRMFRFCGA